MKKFLQLISIYFLLFSLPCFGQQDSFYFKSEYLPERTYIKNISSLYLIEFEIQGDKEMMGELEKNGIENPSIQTEKDKDKLIITTGKLSSINSFPISVKIENPDNSKLEGIVFTGFCKLGEQPVITAITPSQEDKEKEKKIIPLIQRLIQYIEFPKNKMKVGDSFSIEYPANYAMGDILLNIKQITTYFLQEIKGNKAYFNYIQNYIAKMKFDKSEFLGSGEGQGRLVYDLKNHQNIYEKSRGEIKIESGDIYSDVKLQLKMNINIEEKSRIQ